MYTISFFIIVLTLLFLVGMLSKPLDENLATFCLPFNYTNVLRGLAMIMIIYGHICGRYHESVWFSPLACTGVALFLILSGFGNNESYLKKGMFPFTKILKIMIPYWLVIIVTTMIEYDHISWHSFLMDITFIRTSYWFVGYIIIWYLTYWAAVSYFYKYRWCVFCIIAFFSFVFLKPLESEQSLSFITGIYLSEQKGRIYAMKNKRLNIMALGLFAFATIFLVVKQMPVVRNNELLMSITQLMIKLPYAMSLIFGLRYIQWIKYNKLLLLIAPITYELYLCHMPLLKIINPPLSVGSTSYLTFAVVISSILLAILLKKLVKNVFIKLNL